MIFTDRTVIVQKGTSSINDSIVLYRGDREVEIRFTLNESSPFKFGSGKKKKKRYIEIIKDFDKRAYKKEETKSAEDIIFSTIAKAGLKIKGVKK